GPREFPSCSALRFFTASSSRRTLLRKQGLGSHGRRMAKLSCRRVGGTETSSAAELAGDYDKCPQRLAVLHFAPATVTLRFQNRRDVVRECAAAPGITYGRSWR